jgi:hypothetical protein
VHSPAVKRQRTFGVIDIASDSEGDGHEYAQLATASNIDDPEGDLPFPSESDMDM